MVSVVCWALLLTGYSASVNAQVDSTTGNLINYGTSATDTTSVWRNGVYVNQLGCFGGNTPGNCGPYPNVQTNGNINFSYGQVDLNQIVNINKALSAGGNGVQLSGFNFGFTAKNGNGWDDGRQDFLSAYVKFYNAGGGLAANYDYTSQTNRKYNWTNFNFSETFASPIAASNYSNAQVGFVGKDNNYWAGPYGPEIFGVSFSLKYRVDPCATNPAYSATCAGFNNVINSANLFNSSQGGASLNQAFAINTALGLAGSGATVHGLNYGFNYTVGQGFFGCTATNQDGSCSWYMNTPAYVSASMTLRNSDNQVIHQKNYSFAQEETSGSVSEKYLLPSSMNQTLLGTARLTASSSGTGSSISGAWANIIYTADPCAVDPLSSTTCKGYAVAYAKNMLLGSTVASASGPVVSTSSTSMSSPTGQVDQSNPQPEQTQQSQQPQPQQQQPGSSPTQDPGQTIAQSDPAQPSPTQAGPAPTSPQPAGGPAQTTQTASSSSSSGPSGGGAGPSKLAMSVLKSAQDKDKATQNAAVASAAKTLEGSQQSSQASSNLAISMNQDMSANSATAAAQFSSQTTQASQQTAMQTNQSSQQTQQVGTQQQQTSRGVIQQTQQTQQEVQQTQQASSNIIQLQPPQQVVQQIETQPVATAKMSTPQQEVPQIQSQSSTSVVQIQQAAYTPPPQQQETQSTAVAMLKPTPPAPAEVQSQASSGTGLVPSRNPFAYNPLGSINMANTGIQPTQTAPVYQPRIQERIMEVEAPQVQVASFGGMGKAGNPLSEVMMQQRFEMMQENIQPQTSSVNRNVQPNDLAGGIDLASMALQPKGFEAYSFTLRDAAFYEPKEVYKGQTVVDNVRALRQLGSDRLHKEMVDQQYKLGN